MKHFDGFLAFGTQYYRYPTPLEKDWERDLKAIADAGFNTVKIWAQWRSNCPREGEYDFSDDDKLMDICRRNGLRVIINVVFDGAPTWFNAKYPDNYMITASGRTMWPQTIPHRQVGGAPGPCYNHAAGRAERFDFLRALARRYAPHPSLLAWDLWNEPELTVGLLRQPVVENLLCYCDNCRNAMIGWLRKKYSTIDALNDAWHGAFGSFEELELPRDRGVFKPMVDWRVFFADVLTGELKLRADAVKAGDMEHPVMVHTVPLPHFNLITTGSDDYKLARLCDMYGCSIGNEPFAAAITASAAPGKIIIDSEIHAMGGDTFARPKEPTLMRFKREILTPLARGFRGFLFWQYRAEILGREGPAWGLTDLRGRPGPQMGYARQVNDAIQRYAGLITSSSPARARIAIINSGKNQIFNWCAAGSIDIHYRSMRGMFDALYAQGFMVDIISEDQAVEQPLDSYRLIAVPFPYYMDAAFALRIREWVAGGGHLLGEAFFGGLKDEDGYHSEILPGYGFDEVFGCEEESAYSTNAFRDAYYAGMSDADLESSRVPVKLRGSGETIHGYHFIQRFMDKGGEVIADYAGGGAAMVRNHYGNGVATLAGTLLGYRASDNNARFFARLALDAGVSRIAGAPEGIRVDTLERDGAATCVFVCNNTPDSVSADIRVPLLAAGALENAMTGERVPVSAEGCFRTWINPGDIELFAITQ